MIRLVFPLLRVLCLLPALAWAQPPDAAARIVQYDRPDREQFLAAGAKKEGEVAVYTSLISEDLAALSAAFFTSISSLCVDANPAAIT